MINARLKHELNIIMQIREQQRSDAPVIAYFRISVSFVTVF